MWNHWTKTQERAIDDDTFSQARPCSPALAARLLRVVSQRDPRDARRFEVPLRLDHRPAPGTFFERFVVDGNLLTAIVPQPGGRYHAEGVDAVVFICGDDCRDALLRGLESAAASPAAARHPRVPLGERIRNRTICCSWCLGQLPRDRLPYIAPVRFSREPALVERKGSTLVFRLEGGVRHGYIPDFDRGGAGNDDRGMIFVLCSTACIQALRAALVNLIEEARRDTIH